MPESKIINRFKDYFGRHKIFFKTRKYGFSFSFGYSWFSNAYKLIIVVWNYVFSIPVWVVK